MPVSRPQVIANASCAKNFEGKQPMADRLILRDETLRGKALAQIMGLDLSKPWEVTIKPYRKRRSLSQNAYLHKLFDIIATEIGDDRDSVKTAYKDMFAPLVPSPFDPLKSVHKPTSQMTTAEMSEFTEKVIGHAATMGISLPIPEECRAA